MNGNREIDHDPDGPDAGAIVLRAASRGLGSSPRLRGVAAVLWSAFVGASVSLLVILLVPEDWLDPPVGLGRLTAVFGVLFLLALVPAISAALLTHTQTGGSGDAR